MFAPRREGFILILVTEKGINLFSMSRFLEEVEEDGVVFVLMPHEEGSRVDDDVSVELWELLTEFVDLMPEELSPDLPPMRDIHHHFNVLSWSSLPNKQVYCLSQKKSEELQRQVIELHEEGHFGRDKTLALVLSDYYWLKLTWDVAHYVECCFICRRSNGGLIKCYVGHSQETFPRSETFPRGFLRFETKTFLRPVIETFPRAKTLSRSVSKRFKEPIAKAISESFEHWTFTEALSQGAYPRDDHQETFRAIPSQAILRVHSEG